MGKIIGTFFADDALMADQGVLAAFDRVTSLTYAGNGQGLEIMSWDNYDQPF